MSRSEFSTKKNRRNLTIAGSLMILFVATAMLFQNCGEGSGFGVNQKGDLYLAGDNQDSSKDDDSAGNENNNDSGNLNINSPVVVNGVTLPPLPSCPSDSLPTIQVYYKQTNGQFKEFGSPCGVGQNHRGSSDPSLMANSDIYFRIAVHNPEHLTVGCDVKSASDNGISGITDCKKYLNGAPMVQLGGVPAFSGDCFIFNFEIGDGVIRAFCPVALLQ